MNDTSTLDDTLAWDPGSNAAEVIAKSELTLVLIPIIGGVALSNCLKRIAHFGLDCIVVHREQDDLSHGLESRYPAIRFVHAPSGSVPVRRKLGVQSAGTELVVILEDTTLPDDSWPGAILEAFLDNRVGGVSGPVTIGNDLPHRCLALACGEYGRFHPRRLSRLAIGEADRRGICPVLRLPGNHLAYRRSLILELLTECSGLIETEINQRIIERGLRLVMHPAMSVTYAAADAYYALVSTRFQQGRLYAGNRVTGRGLGVRMMSIAMSVALPVLLSVRALAATRDLSGSPSRARVAGWILLLESAWACGEGIGYLAGPGTSMDSWR